MSLNVPKSHKNIRHNISKCSVGKMLAFYLFSSELNDLYLKIKLKKKFQITKTQTNCTFVPEITIGRKGECQDSCQILNYLMSYISRN